MNPTPLISIILPVFNGEQYLRESIESCLNQTYTNFELIIVNDASTDNSLQIALNYATRDDRVRIHNNERNSGLPASLNIGHKLAHGNLFSWTSHDNYYSCDAVETMVDAIQKNDVDVVYSNYNIIEHHGAYRREVIQDENSNIILANTVGASFLYKKEVFFRNRGYNESLHTVEDYDFWLKTLIHSKFTHIPRNLYSYRVHKNSLSSQIDKKDTEENKNFRTKLKSVYNSFFENFSLSRNDYSEIFTCLHRHEKINIYTFLNEYGNFIKDIFILEEKIPSFNSNSFFRNVDLRLRMNMQTHRENQNLKTLIQICKIRPKLLTHYDRRRSLKYIAMCFTK